MKKIVALVLTMVMVLTAVSALAVFSKGVGDLVQEESKVIRTNPVTNEEEEVESVVTVVKSEDKATAAGKVSAKSKLVEAMSKAVTEATEKVQKEIEASAAKKTGEETAEEAAKRAEEAAEKTNEAVNEAIINVLPEAAQEALKAAAAESEKLNVENLTTINETTDVPQRLSGEVLENGANLQEGETLAVTMSFPTVYEEDSVLCIMIGILNEDHTGYIGYRAVEGRVVDGKVQYNLKASDIAAIGYSDFDVYVLE